MMNRSKARHDSLQTMIDRLLVETPSVRSIALRVDSPELRWKGAAGFADPERGIAMTPNTPFRSASIGKMILAATVLLLVAAQAIALDSPAIDYIPEAWPTGLHRIAGQSYDNAVTVRQLINHTSGIADYFSDGGAPGAPAPFVLEMVRDPDKLWDPREIVAWTAERLTAHFTPGNGWHYSDTGFLLAGLIVESVTGRPLHAVYRERLFDPLGMADTYMVYREPSPSGKPESMAYSGDVIYTSHRATSADWAGGGLVTTTDDLTRFMRAMAENRVFRHPSTRAAMLQWTPTGEAGIDYGLGVRRLALDTLGEPLTGELWGHTGALNTAMFYYPPLDLTLVGTMNQSDAAGIWSAIRPVPVWVREVLRRIASETGVTPGEHHVIVS